MTSNQQKSQNPQKHRLLVYDTIFVSLGWTGFPFDTGFSVIQIPGDASLWWLLSLWSLQMIPRNGLRIMSAGSFTPCEQPVQHNIYNKHGFTPAWPTSEPSSMLARSWCYGKEKKSFDTGTMELGWDIRSINCNIMMDKRQRVLREGKRLSPSTVVCPAPFLYVACVC